MLLTTFLLAIPVAPIADFQEPGTPLENAVQRELRLYDIGDLINPATAMREQIERDFLASTLDLALTSDSEEINAAERFALEVAKRAMEVQEQKRKHDLFLEEIYAANRAESDFFAQVANKRQYAFDSEQALRSAIETYMVPAFANSGGSLKFDVHQGRPVLIGYLTIDQSDWLQSFLKYQRVQQGWMANISVTVLAPEGDSAEIPEAFRAARVVSDTNDVMQQLDQLQSQGWGIVSSPKLMLWPWHQGDLSVLNQVSYVSGYTIEVVEPGNQQIADPHIDVLQEGLLLGCQVRQVDADHYGLHLEIDYSEIKRPIPTEPLVGEEFPANLNLRISKPDVRTTSMEADARMTDGSGLILGASSTDGGRPLILLVQFNRIQPEEVESPNSSGRR
jgi:hypothetical protein